jgi:predicted MPP superfamily phosphohydrolase
MQNPHQHTFFRKRGHAINKTVLVLMAAGASVAYALGSISEGLPDPARSIVLWCGIACALLSFGLFYARFIEPSWIVVTRKKIDLRGLHGLRIAVVGDFHVGPHKQDAFVRRAAAVVNAEKPDIILLVGDFLFDHASDVAHLAPLRDLRAPLGTYAVLGNHDSDTHGPHATAPANDRSDDIERFLTPLGVTFLRNRSVTHEFRGHRFCVAGTDDVWMKTHDLAAALKDIPADLPVILLTHNADATLDAAAARASLIVSGHTHGGQLRLPFFGPLTKLPQKLSKKFDRGLFPLSSTCTLAITHGIGETFLPLRFFARPEVLVLEAR